MWKGEFGRRGMMPGHEMSGRIEALGAGRDHGLGRRAGQGRRPDRAGLLHGVQSMRELRERQSCRRVTAKVVGAPHPDDPPHFTATFATHYFVRPDQHFYRIPDNVPDWSRLRPIARCRRCSGVWIAARLQLRRQAGGARRGRTRAACDGDREGARRARNRDRRRRSAAARGATIRRRRSDRHARSIPTPRRATSACASCAADGPTWCWKWPAFPRHSAKRSRWCAVGGRVIEVGNISSGLTVQSPLSDHLQIAGNHRRSDLPAALSKKVARLPGRQHRSPSLSRNVRRKFPAVKRGRSAR